MEQRITELEKQLAVHTESFRTVRAEMNALHEAYKTEAANIRSEIQTELRKFGAEMHGAVAEMRGAVAEMQRTATSMQASLTAHTRWTFGIAVAAVFVIGIIVRWPVAG